MKVATLVLVARLSAGAVIHVDADAAGLNDGSSWTDAFTDLQSALSAAVSGDEVWVAEGTYLPTVESVVALPRSKTFALVAGVGLYGGFVGTESLRTERDWIAHETILSGDIGGAGVVGDNAYHVVIGASDATLDGFTVSRGNANGPDPGWKGGGMYNDAVTGLTVANCTFSANTGDGWGGGLYNENYTSATIVNCTFTGNTMARGAGLYNRSSSPVITGCTFSNNYAGVYGAGMLNHGDSFPLITNCVFSDNVGEYNAGAMYNVIDCSPTISGCTFTNNEASHGYGGAVRNWDSSPILENCRFLGNRASEGGGAIHNCYDTPTITGCVFSGNTGPQGGGMMNTFTSPTIANCTFSENVADYGGGVYNHGASPSVTNCIFWGDSSSDGREICDDGSSSSTVTYSCVAGGWPGTGNIDANPLFVDADGADDVVGTPDDDLSLQAGSPCIDAADGDAAPATDLDGNSRHDDPGLVDAGSGVPTYADMGAYEFQGTTAGEQLTISNPPAGVLMPVGTSLEIRWLATGNVTQVEIELSRNGGANWELIAAPTSNDRSHVWTVTDGGNPLPQPDCSVRVSDATDGVPTGASGSFTIFDGILHVDADAPGPTRDGFSWATAFLHPQDAVDAAWAGTEVRVAEGTYLRRGGSDTVVLMMEEGVTICGGYAGYGQPDPDERDVAVHVTTLDGEDTAYHVVEGASNATLDGFTMSRGNAIGGMPPEGTGGGLHNYCVTGLTVAHCTFSGNAADRCGGGMANDCSSVLVTDCAFTDNTASFRGGGMDNDESSSTVRDCAFSNNTAGSVGGGTANVDSSPTLMNCTFSGNASDDGGGIGSYQATPAVTGCTFSGNTASSCGGGMYNWLSSPTVTNCTFSGNAAALNGGGIYNYDVSSPAVTNCTLWGDSAPTGPEIDNDGTSSCTVSYSDVAQVGGFDDGGGNISADPGFVDADGPDDVPGTLDDDLHLQAGSPCIDAADGSAAPAADMDGLPRCDDPDAPNTGTGTPNYADIGAYEFQSETTATPFGGGCAAGAGAALAFCVLALRRRMEPQMHADGRR